MDEGVAEARDALRPFEFVLGFDPGESFALLRILLGDPPVLLLDEPTGALDPDSVARVERLLHARRATGTAMVLVTHDAAQAARLADRRMALRDGRLHMSLMADGGIPIQSRPQCTCTFF